jgi:radical SAM enzyme (TIGR01210 family)
VSLVYPSTASARTRWILQRRGPRPAVLPGRTASFMERERNAAGHLDEVLTVFLANRECPWKCVMCDLWRHTTEHPVAATQIIGQIQSALAQFPGSRVLKLYNSGSFFDVGAIPRETWPAISDLCRGLNHLIVECHPRLIDQNVLRFAALLPCSLEIALGLETAHPQALEALNKRITLQDFARAARLLRQNRIALRTFLLVHPPFVPDPVAWLRRSIDFAFEHASDVVSLIPLRAGNGAVEELIRQGQAAIPTLRDLEDAQQLGLTLGAGRVFADTWDLATFSRCNDCFSLRAARIQRLNFTQTVESRVFCPACRA